MTKHETFAKPQGFDSGRAVGVSVTEGAGSNAYLGHLGGALLLDRECADQRGTTTTDGQ